MGIDALIDKFESTIATVFINIAKYDYLPRIVYDNKGRFIYVNDKFADLLGYKSSELAGVQYVDLLYNEDVNSTLSVFNHNVIHDHIEVQSNFKNRYIHKSGKIVYLRWFICYYDNLNKIGSGQCEVITETEWNKI